MFAASGLDFHVAIPAMRWHAEEVDLSRFQSYLFNNIIFRADNACMRILEYRFTYILVFRLLDAMLSRSSSHCHDLMHLHCAHAQSSEKTSLTPLVATLSIDRSRLRPHRMNAILISLVDLVNPISLFSPCVEFIGFVITCRGELFKRTVHIIPRLPIYF